MESLYQVTKLQNIWKIWEIKQNKTIPRALLPVFAASVSKHFFCRGNWTLDCVPMQFWDFLMFPYFQKIPCFKSTFIQGFRFKLLQFVTIQVPFYLWWMKRVLKLCKILSYYAKGHLKIFLLLITFLK